MSEIGGGSGQLDERCADMETWAGPRGGVSENKYTEDWGDWSSQSVSWHFVQAMAPVLSSLVSVSFFLSFRHPPPFS